MADDVGKMPTSTRDVGKMPTSTGDVGKVLSGTELWDRVLADLRGQMTFATFQSVFGGSQAGFFDGEALDVALVSKSACEWATERLRAVVERAVVSVVGSPVAVWFSTAKDAKGNEKRERGNGEGSGQDAHTNTEVRDNRRVGWYRVDNVVLDDYLPFMGIRAFAVYSLYCRMSGRDGLSWPGYAYVCKILGIGRATLSKCNQVLECLGLIEIERGDRTRSNRYYLLEPEVLTLEVVSKIRERAERFGLDVLVGALDVALTGLDEVVPTENHGSSPPEPGWFPTGTRVVPTENQGSSPPEPEQDISNKTQEQDKGTRGPDSVCSGESSSDNELADWLVELGIARSAALKLILAHERGRIVAWYEYILEQDSIKRPAAFLVHKLKDGGWP